jgi:hypothetical protein
MAIVVPVDSTNESRNAFLIGTEWALIFNPLSLSDVNDKDIITINDSMAMLLLVSVIPLGKPPETMAATNANTIIVGLLVRVFQGFTSGRSRCPINWFRD